MNTKKGLSIFANQKSFFVLEFNCNEKPNCVLWYSQTGNFTSFFSECLDITDPVFTFDRFMEEIDLRKYLSKLPAHELGRIRYNPVNMLKTVLFGFMDEGCISLRKLEDNCKVNIRYKYLMDGKCPSYRTFGYFINTVLMNQAESLFYEITQEIITKEHVDLDHLYIDGSKFEANANKYSWVWKKVRRSRDSVCILKFQHSWKKSMECWVVVV